MKNGKPLRPCVRVIVTRSGKIMIGWKNVKGVRLPVFPGGGIEKGDTLEEAAQKEVLEEVGVSVTDVTPIGVEFEYPGMDLGKGRSKEFSGAKDTYVMAKFHKVDKSLLNTEGDAFTYTWETPGSAYVLVKNSPPSEKNEARLLALTTAIKRMREEDAANKTLRKW